MRSIQISKQYLWSVLLMVMALPGVVSCNCFNRDQGEKGPAAGEPSISFKDNGAALEMHGIYDANGKAVTIFIDNIGKKDLEANEATLRWNTNSAAITIKSKEGNQKQTDSFWISKDLPIGTSQCVILSDIQFHNPSFDDKLTLTIELDWNQLKTPIKATVILDKDVADKVRIVGKIQKLQGEIVAELKQTNPNFAKVEDALKKIGNENNKMPRVIATSSLGVMGEVIRLNTLIIQGENEVTAAVVQVATDTLGEIEKLKVKIVDELKDSTLAYEEVRKRVLNDVDPLIERMEGVSVLSVQRMLPDQYAIISGALKAARQASQTIVVAAIAKEVEKKASESNEAIGQGKLKKALDALLDMDGWTRKIPLFLTPPNTDTESILKKIDKIHDDTWDAYKKAKGIS